MTIFVPAKFNTGFYQGSLAQYHQLRVTSTHQGSFLDVAEVGFLDDWAGAKMSGTPFIAGDIQLGPAGHAFDDDVGTSVEFTMSTNPIIGLDHGVAQRLVEFYVQAPLLNWDRMPSEMVLEETTAGVTTTVRTYSGLLGWRPGERRYFSVADRSLAPFSGKWRYQRVRPTVIASTLEFSPAELQFFTNIGDTVNMPGTIISAQKLGGAVITLNDGDPFTRIRVALADEGGWIGIYHGHTPLNQAAQMLMGVYWDQVGQVPTEFVFECSNWASDYTAVRAFTVTPAWSNFEVRRFAV